MGVILSLQEARRKGEPVETGVTSDNMGQKTFVPNLFGARPVWTLPTSVQTGRD